MKCGGTSRAEHLAIRTEEAYTKWIERFLNFEREIAGDWKHPEEMGVAEVNRSLTHLATVNKVAASTQVQAASRPQKFHDDFNVSICSSPAIYSLALRAGIFSSPG